MSTVSNCLELLTIAAAGAAADRLLSHAGGRRADGRSPRKREPIAAVLADPSTPPKLRTRLEYVAAARDFASRELGLPDNE